MLSLKSNDFVRSLMSAVAVAVVAAVGGIVLGEGFDLFATDWVALGKMVANVSVITFFGRLMEKFLSDKDGKLFGSIG